MMKKKKRVGTSIRYRVVLCTVSLLAMTLQHAPVRSQPPASFAPREFGYLMAESVNPNRPLESRRSALRRLHSVRRGLPPDEQLQLLDTARLLAFDKRELVALRQDAISSLAALTALLRQTGALAALDSRNDVVALVQLATDAGSPPGLRGTAIRGLSIVDASAAVPAIRGLLSDPLNLHQPDIARPAVLALAKLEGEAAVSTIRDVLTKTQDESVFGSTAFALGQLKNTESLRALVEACDRFPGTGSCENALAGMPNLIFDILSNHSSPELDVAIVATRSLWLPEYREQARKLLTGVLQFGSLAAQRASLTRLFDDLATLEVKDEKVWLKRILVIIRGRPEFATDVVTIEMRLRATELQPVESSVATP